MADDLAAEWHRLRARSYAEEGIPVIVGVETVGRPALPAGEPAVAAEFRELAAALAGSEKASPAAIIEMIAARAVRRLE